MKDSTFKKFVRQPRFDEHLELHRLDCEASHHDLTSYQFTRQRIASIPPEAIRPAPLVSGDDLIAAGYCRGRNSRKYSLRSKMRNSKAGFRRKKWPWST